MKKEALFKMTHDILDGMLIRTWKVVSIIGLTALAQAILDIGFLPAFLSISLSFLVNDLSNLFTRMNKFESELKDLKKENSCLKWELESKQRKYDSLDRKIGLVKLDISSRDLELIDLKYDVRYLKKMEEFKWRNY
jgi:hypothetical protein